MMVRIGLAGAVAVVVGIQLYPFLLWSPVELAAHGLLFDDAFFYSVLAKNFRRFGFLTLDGDMATNGVQPLWMWTQLVLAKAFPNVDTATILVRSTWITYMAFSFLSVWFVARGRARTALLRTLLVSGLVLLNWQFQIIVVQGLETSLFLLVMVTTLIMCDAWLGIDSRDPRQEVSSARLIAIACAASLCFLARTDFFWILPAVAAWIVLRVNRPVRALRTFGVVSAMLIVPYLAYNLSAHGALMPISGRVKLFYLHAFLPNRASYLASDEWHGLFAALPVLIRLPATVALSTKVVITVALLGAGLLGVWRLHRLGQLPTGLAILTWAIVGHILFMQFACRELREYTSYYFAGEIWWLAVGIALWICPSAREGETNARSPQGLRLSFAALAVVVAVGAASFGWAVRRFEPSSYWIERLHLADDIKRLPNEAKIGAFWPGCFAAFSGRDITPLDGIVGSNDYFQNYLKSGKEFDYIHQRRIDYIAVYLPDSAAAILSRSKPPSLANWSELGVRRLWENRDLPISIVAKRTVNGGDVGWYLLHVGGERHTARISFEGTWEDK